MASSTINAAMRPESARIVVAEVVVAGMFAAERCAGLGHHLFDERMADASAQRSPAMLVDQFGHGA